MSGALREVAEFAAFVRVAVLTPEFLVEYDRLKGTALAPVFGKAPRRPLDVMIDHATGRTVSEMRQLVRDLYDMWRRLPR